MASETNYGPSYVFLSYASEDRAKALGIADLLEAQGISVWIDRKSIAGGTSWGKEIVRGIRACGALLVLSSSRSLHSRNVQQEIQVAWEHDRPILPLMLEPADLTEDVEYALAGRQWIEVLDRPDEVWLPQAVRALQSLGLGPQRSDPAVAGPPTTGRVDPTLPRTPVARHNLPTRLTSFVGRERELAEVRRLVGSTRLLTITGVGGTGKTRLVLEIAPDLVASHPDGVWFVDLAPLADPTLVAPTIASTLGVVEEAGRPIAATIVDVLRDRSVLLILDNCEHLIDTCARLAETILQGCPRVRIVATSREALGIAGEASWSLPSLPVPPADWEQAHPGAGVVALEEFAAVRLFVERARAADASFEFTAQNAAAVVQICRRVDGIPLAIELAAARVKVFSVERIVGRLDDLFRLLTGGSRTALPRQQTLRALIDWSYNLLDEPERRLFRRLSVFVGGCSYEAIESVCAGEGIDELDVPDLLTRLVDRSLVEVQRTDQERYRLLETLRQYGRDRLVESGEAETVRNRHRDWFVALAERVEPELIGPRQVDWLDRLEIDLANFRAALAWCLEGGGSETLGLRLAAALWRLWHVRDYESEGLEWLGRVLAAPGAQNRTATRAKALQGVFELGGLGTGNEILQQARAAEESLAICQEIGDSAGASWSMNLVARDALDQGDYAQAEVLLTQALALARESRARWAMAQVLEGLSILATSRQDYGQAWQRTKESLELFREVGDQRAIAWALIWLGGVALERGDLSSARAIWNESFAIVRELRSRVRIAVNLVCLGILARAEGKHAESRACFEESQAISRVIGTRWLTGWSLACQAWLTRSEGNRGEAKILTREALRLFQNSSEAAGLLGCLTLAGVLAVKDDVIGSGVGLLAHAATLMFPQIWELPLHDDRQARDQSVAAARAKLSDDDFERAWAEGQAMSREQAIGLALSLPD